MRHSYLIGFLLCVTTAFSQGKNDRINTAFVDADLEEILDTLSAQTGYFFSYNSDLLPKGNKYTISANNLPIDQFLSTLLVGTNLKYSFYKEQIIINYEPPETPIVKRRKFFNVSGNVSDEAGEPLLGVNVFLDGTTIGVATDLNGNFKLDKIPPGYYDLVFSYLGYERGIYSISEYNGGSRIQSHQMKPAISELGEVEVSAKRVTNTSDLWGQYFALFKRDLFGTSQNSSLCSITNPEVINFVFSQTDNRLTAFASSPIKITNEAMAYGITYHLESFERQDMNLRYRGRIRFHNDYNVSNQFSKNEIKSERKRSYHGSFNHFKRALLGNRLRKEGFRIYETSSLSNNRIERLEQKSEEDIIVFKGNSWELNFDNYLLVVYGKEKESTNFLMDGQYSSVMYSDDTAYGKVSRQPRKQVSILKLLNGPVELDLNGQVVDKFALTSYGYWSWERLANLVPINYDPKFDNL